MQATAMHSNLSPAEIALAKRYLELTGNCAIGAIKGMSETQWAFRPGGAWSIAEIMEHVVFVQGRVLAIVRDHIPSAPNGPANRNVAKVDAIILGVFPNRFEKFPAPEFAVPKGGMTLADAIEQLNANTRRLTEALESIPDLRDHLLESPPLKAVTKGEEGVMDGYQWILTVAAHTDRHTKQILEARASAEFPAN